jgi:DNA-binding transcriptional ArsR family regulator
MLYKCNMLKEARHDLILKALGDYRRRKILDLIRDRPRTTGELCNHFKNLDRCTVMQHLSVLERAELIIVKRRGSYRWNYINPLPIKEIYDRWICNYSAKTVDLLARLKQEIEK